MHMKLAFPTFGRWLVWFVAMRISQGLLCLPAFPVPNHQTSPDLTFRGVARCLEVHKGGGLRGAQGAEFLSFLDDPPWKNHQQFMGI